MTLISRKANAVHGGEARLHSRRSRNLRGGYTHALLCAVCLWGTSCLEASGKSGVPGELDAALFSAQSDLVFTERLLTGGTIVMRLAARRAADDEAFPRAVLRSSNENIVRVDSVVVQPAVEGNHQELHAEVALLAAGEATLEVLIDDALFDQIAVRVVEPVHLGLLDGTLLATEVDARLPTAFAVAAGTKIPLALEALDRCGGAALDLGAVRVDVENGGPEIGDAGTVDSDEPESSLPIDVQVDSESMSIALGSALSPDAPLTPRSGQLTLSHPALAEPASFDVMVVPPSMIDEVNVEVVTANPTEASLWARAYSDDIEVIGLSYSWDSSERVTLDRGEGAVVSATVSFPEEGEPVDERPAVVGAEVYGTEGERDLFALTSRADLVMGRLPAREPAAATGPSCGDTGASCDPYALAFLVFGLGFRRRAVLRFWGGGQL
ncbi:MAG: hypothetical protein ACO3JL_05075 [Myxococcota bacterium]